MNAIRFIDFLPYAIHYFTTRYPVMLINNK